jgi:hypothetical protein
MYSSKKLELHRVLREKLLYPLKKFELHTQEDVRILSGFKHKFQINFWMV